MSDYVSMVSYVVWQCKYGGDPGIIGETVRINGYPVTLIGVCPMTMQPINPNTKS